MSSNQSSDQLQNIFQTLQYMSSQLQLLSGKVEEQAKTTNENIETQVDRLYSMNDQLEKLGRRVEDLQEEANKQPEMLKSFIANLPNATNPTNEQLSEQLQSLSVKLEAQATEVSWIKAQIRPQQLLSSQELSVWFPNKKQIEQILNEKVRKRSSQTILEKMNNGEAYDVQPNSHGKSGYCLIVNIKQSCGPVSIRYGSEYDVSCVKYLMELQFLMDVEVLQDCTTEEFNQKIDQVLSNEHLKNFKCVVVFLMAHGDGDKLQMYDGEWINFRESVEYKLGDCAALVGKPKLLFIESCEGPQQDRGLISHDGPSPETEDPKVKHTIKMAGSMPKQADMVVVRATHAPIKAARHNRFGTFFVQAVCQVFKVDAHLSDISTLCDQVNAIMRSIQILECYQIPMFSKTLAKPFYFYCQGTPAKTCILMAGGYHDYSRYREEKNHDLEVTNGVEIKSIHNLPSEWVFNQHEGFLLNESIFGFAGFWNTEASLLQLHLPTMLITEVVQHPCAYRYMSTCQMDQSNLVATTGGSKRNTDDELAVAYLLDIEKINTDSPFRQLPNMLHRRRWHSVMNFKQNIIATGGWVDSKWLFRVQSFRNNITKISMKNYATFRRKSDSCELLLLDPAEERWIEVPSLISSRSEHASAVLDERLFVAGGYGGERSVEFLDSRIEKWQQAAPMKQKRMYFPLTVFNEKIFAFGGWNGTTEFYDKRMDCWLTGPDMAREKVAHVAVVVPEVILNWA